MQRGSSPVSIGSRRREQRFVALHNPYFRLYWLSTLASFLGTQMQLIAQGWLVLDLTNSPFYLGLVGGAAGLPILIFSLFGGVMADRMERRRLLIICQLATTVLTFALTVLIGTGLVKVWHVIAMALLTGVITAFNNPARQAFISDLVKEDELLNAVSLSAASMNITRIGGPAVAGAIIGATGVVSCYLINTIAQLVAAITLFPIRGSTQVMGTNKATVWSNAVEGVHFVRGNKPILWLLALGIPSIFGTMGVALVPVFARDILHVGASGLGLMMGASGVGALVGSLVIAGMGNLRRKGIMAGCSGMLFNVGNFFLAFSTWFPLSVAGMAIQGVAGSGWTASVTTLLQTLSPSELRGRVMSIYFITMQAVPLAQIMAGILATWIGAPWTVAVGGILAFCLNLSALVVTPVLRRLD